MIISQPNKIQSGVGFYISYNSVDQAYYGSDTTALVTRGMDAFYILNGDHRKEYAELVPKGYEVCKSYYDSVPHLHNKFTDTPEKLQKLRDLMNKNTSPNNVRRGYTIIEVIVAIVCIGLILGIIAFFILIIAALMGSLG